MLLLPQSSSSVVSKDITNAAGQVNQRTTSESTSSQLLPPTFSIKLTSQPLPTTAKTQTKPKSIRKQRLPENSMKLNLQKESSFRHTCGRGRTPMSLRPLVKKQKPRKDSSKKQFQFTFRRKQKERWTKMCAQYAFRSAYRTT